MEKYSSDKKGSRKKESRSRKSSQDKTDKPNGKTESKSNEKKKSRDKNSAPLPPHEKRKDADPLPSYEKEKRKDDSLPSYNEKRRDSDFPPTARSSRPPTAPADDGDEYSDDEHDCSLDDTKKEKKDRRKTTDDEEAEENNGKKDRDRKERRKKERKTARQKNEAPVEYPKLPDKPPSKGWVIGPTVDIKKEYTLGVQIGEEGGTGHAVEAVHIATGDKRAVKIMDKTVLQPEDILAARNEVLVMQKLHHKHVVKAYGFYETATHMYIAMEQCKGGELFDYIVSQGKMNEDDARKVFQQITSALKYLHSIGIVHCDLKPANVLFKETWGSEEDIIKVIDFGTSKFTTRGVSLSEKVGSPFYIAPEVLQGRYTEHCDMWSMGCLTFVMVFGYPPFDADDLNSTKIVDQLEKGFDPVTKPGHGPWFPEKIPCSPALKDLISKMLTKDTATRISAAEALEHPWVRAKTLSNKKISEAVLKPVNRFTKPTKLRDFLLPTLADQNAPLSELDISELKEQFKLLDKNGDGLITPEDLQGLFESSTINHIFEVAGNDQNISYEDLLNIAMQKRLVSKEDRLQNLFGKLDVNGKGCVTEKDIKRYCDVVTPKAQEIIAEVDSNGKGGMDYDDFVNIWVKRKKTKPVVAPETAKKKQEEKAIGVPIGLKLSNAEDGVLVEIAQAGLPAAEAGIKQSDVIIKVNGKPVDSVDAFRQVGQSFVPGTRAMFVVRRGGQNKVVTVRL